MRPASIRTATGTRAARWSVRCVTGGAEPVTSSIAGIGEPRSTCRAEVVR